MNEEGFKRKLAAILSADVVEYSRLMREDEKATIQKLWLELNALIFFYALIRKAQVTKKDACGSRSHKIQYTCSFQTTGIIADEPKLQISVMIPVKNCYPKTTN